MAGRDADQPNAPDGLMNDQEMPTADGQMASNTSEAVVPPEAKRTEDPSWGADSGNGGPGVTGDAGVSGRPKIDPESAREI